MKYDFLTNKNNHLNVQVDELVWEKNFKREKKRLVARRRREMMIGD